jgi:hypothetical protein
VVVELAGIEIELLNAIDFAGLALENRYRYLQQP